MYSTNYYLKEKIKGDVQCALLIRSLDYSLDTFLTDSCVGLCHVPIFTTVENSFSSFSSI